MNARICIQFVYIVCIIVARHCCILEYEPFIYSSLLSVRCLRQVTADTMRSPLFKSVLNELGDDVLLKSNVDLNDNTSS